MTLPLTGAGLVLGAPLSLPATWDPANTSASITLSNSNLDATSGASGDHNTKSTTTKSSGKWYFEIVNIGGGNGGAGVCTSIMGVDTWVGSGNESVGYDFATGTIYMAGTSQGVTGLGSVGSGQVVGVAFDMATGKAYFSKQGSFGSQDPVAGTGGYNLPFPLTSLNIVGACYSSGVGVRLRTIAGSFSTAPPSGYSAWN